MKMSRDEKFEPTPSFSVEVSLESPDVTTASRVGFVDPLDPASSPKPIEVVPKMDICKSCYIT